MLMIFPDKFYKAFDGSNPADVKKVKMQPALNALKSRHKTDAHFSCYSVPRLESQGEGLRIKKTALKALIEDGAEPQLNYVALDIDLPDHREWTEADKKAFTELYANTPLLHTAGIYFTKHGWRAVWPLEEPVPARFADSFLTQFIKHARAQGIDADEACNDWTRLFRLPTVRRDGVDEPERLKDFSNMAPLEWNPDGLEDATFCPAPVPRDPDAPDPVDHPWVLDALDCISPDCAYEKWLKVGIALKEEFGQDGLQAWDEWSRRATHKYDGYQSLVDKWKTFDGTRRDNKITLGTIAHIAKPGGFEVPKTQEQKEKTAQLAEIIGVEEDLARFYLLIKPTAGSSYYVWDERKLEYRGPVDATSVPNYLERYCPVILGGWHRSTKGKIQPMNEIMTRVGTVATKNHLILGAEKSTFKLQGRVMQEAAGRVTPGLEPEFDPEIDKWLTLLGGDRADSLKDWLACYLEFDKPICSLYIDGRDSIGKGLLAEGIATGFHDTKWTAYETLTASFNESMTRCPLIVADESTPDGAFDNNSSSVFRRLIGTSEIQINRKYKSPAVMKGSPRLLITANGDDALQMREELTQQDIDAITRRIGYIKMQDDAPADYLESLGGRPYTEAWVDGRGLARHILWLKENRKVKHGHRFLVEGWESELVDNFNLKTGMVGDVALALVDYLEQGNQSDYMPFGGGELYVHLKTFHEMWNSLTSTRSDPPSQRKLSKALQQINLGRVRPKIRDKRPTMYNIDIEALKVVAEDLGKMQPEEVDDILSAKMQHRLTVVK